MTDRNDEKPGRLEKVVGWVDDAGELPEADPNADEGADESVAEQLLVNSMLQGHFDAADVREARVRSILNRFDQLESESPAARPTIGFRKPKTITRWLQVAASLAALLLVAASIWYVSKPLTAEAALQSVIESVEAQVTRVYAGTIKGQWLGRKTNLKFTLRSPGSNKFVVEMHNTLVKPKLVGSDGKERWTISGRRTWNSSDRSRGLRDFLIDRATFRSFQINRLIVEIPDNYELKLLEPEQLPGDDSVECRPIQATLIGENESLPMLVRIWAHPDTGDIARMEVHRKLENSTKIQLTLMSEEPVNEEIFRQQYHLKK